MPVSLKPLLRPAVVAVVVLCAQGSTIQPGASSLNPSAGLFPAGVSPRLDAGNDWRPLGPASPLDVQHSMVSVAHYPEINPLPEGEDYIPHSGLLMLMTLCR